MKRPIAMATLSLGVAAAACGTNATGIAGPSVSSAEIVGVTWRLTGLQKPGEPVTAPPEASFTLELREDGLVHLVADCNVCNGSYALGEGTLEVEGELLACTLAACPTAPFDTDYAGIVAGARTWEADTSRLAISGDSGSLSFERDQS